ncbi:MAG TPA: VWA domain-containing protein [Thermoanaerobaculia bacterium]|nr:VWA domain-containing protein [Thermoanaerobaculia bacterium]
MQRLKSWLAVIPGALCGIALSYPILAQEMKIGETIEVSRVIVDAHVVYDDGSPVLGLEASDFRVRIDRRPAEIESLEWVSASTPYGEGVAPSGTGESFDVPTPKGRLLVMFFQTDFQRADSRLGGQIRMIHYAKEFLETLSEDDRVAVVSFDSHLKLRQDFTSDRNRLIRAIEESVRIDTPAPLEIVAEPSLRARLTALAARNSKSPEEALFHIGNALLPVPGAKSLILFGWGLGRLTRGGVQMERFYHVARTALEAARTAVFSLDVSTADYHSLEAGLSKVSSDTGGFYVKTNNFPQFAMDKLQRAISGHYVLVVKKPTLPRGRHAIVVQVPGRRKIEVMARSSFQD